ncbi:MAG: thiol:disulfide interchange protein DsbA/DsbL [Steroidobacteraceae bacterium]
MKRMFLTGVALIVSTLTLGVHASPETWVQGRNYVLVNPAQDTHVAAGKVEVLEVFSYGCPACNYFQPVIEKLEGSLPANAQMVFLPTSFSAAEDMPMFQRAFFAAQSLGVAEQAHQAIFDAVWKTGELAVVDPDTHRLKFPLPTLEDAARCYGHITGVKPEDFLRAARSFGVEVKMRTADAQIIAMQVPGTPCLVVNGKYRIELDTLNSTQDVIDIVRFLVSKESLH